MLRPKDDIYYRGVREDIGELIPEGAGRVLDVGCGCGMTGERLKAKGVKEVVGIELDLNAYNEARTRLDRVIHADVERLRLPFKRRYFDYIIYADILEHLIDPWSVLKNQRELLKDDGGVIASIPNVSHYRVIKKLKRGQWPYEERGVLDSTHLRFFTLKTIEKMFTEAGYQIDRVIYRISASRIKRWMNRVLFGRLNEPLSEQFLIMAKKI